MTQSAVQMICLALVALGLIGAIRCWTIPQWLVWVNEEEDGTSVEYQDSPWMRCLKQSTGKLNCEMVPTFMLTPIGHAFRAMTVISCILCGLSLVILFFGSDFTTCFQNQGTKLKLSLVAAAGLLLAGLLVIVPVSWSAHTIIRYSYNPILASAMERGIGASIYIGWAAGVLMILAGVLLCCFRRPRSSSSEGTTSYHSNRASVIYDDVM